MKKTDKINEEDNIRYISLLSDLVFKTLWTNGSKLTKNYLYRIISEIVGYDVSKYSLSTNELGMNNYKSMANRVDILLISEDKKTKINVELNKSYSDTLIRKNDVYLYKLAGETYTRNSNDKPYEYDINVCQININNFYNLENKNISMNYYILADPINNLTKQGIKFYNLYLPKIKNMCYDVDEELYLDLAMFEAHDYEEMSVLAKDNEERNAVMEDLKKLGSDTEFVDLYDHDEFQKAVEKEMYSKGIEEGKAEGITQGAQARSVEIAKNMKENGIEIALIIKCSGLSKEEIENL